MTAHPWLIPALPAAVAAIAVVLLWLGLRGRRVDDHPVCRRCAYDLIGLPADRAACPECGNDLLRPRAMRTGNRRRRRGLIALAALLLVPSAAALAVIGWVAARGVDLQPRKPVWWLLGDADGPDAGARAAALAELTRRLTAGTLSDRQVLAVAGRALDAQGNSARTWDTAWGDWVEQAQAAGRLPAEQWQRYVRQGIHVKLQVRPTVRRGDPIPYELGTVTRFGRTARFRILALRPVFDVSGRAALHTNHLPRFEEVVGPASEDRWGKGGLLDGPDFPWDRLADGSQTLRLSLDLHVYPVSSTEWIPTEPPVVRKQMVAQAAWRLLPADEPSVRQVVDPALREAVQAAVGVRLLTLHETPDGPRVIVYIHAIKPPVDVAWDVSVGPGGQEWPVGTAWGKRAPSSIGNDCGDLCPGLTADVVDVVFRPSVPAAVRKMELTEIWGEQVVVQNVPVLRLPPPMPPATTAPAPGPQ